jgi:gas vesicle protein
MNKLVSFVIGAFSGALVSSILVLLLTPMKGTEVRARLGNSFVHVQNEVKTAAQKRVDELNQQLARLQNKVTE